MSEAKSGVAVAFVPGFRFAHPGYKAGLLRRGACHRARIRATRWLLAMTGRAATSCRTTPANQKAGSRPAILVKSFCSHWEPGRSEAPPGLEGYFLDFFFDFDFFAFFAFFAFLAIVSSQGLMDGNATRGMLGGGPASQHPRMQSQQIRGALPRTVTALSSRYPQLLCVLGAISRNFRSSCPGLTRASINFQASWIAGSSPAMTSCEAIAALAPPRQG